MSDKLLEHHLTRHRPATDDRPDRLSAADRASRNIHPEHARRGNQGVAHRLRRDDSLDCPSAAPSQLTFRPKPVLPFVAWFPAAVFEQLEGATRDLIVRRPGSREPFDRTRDVSKRACLGGNRVGSLIQGFWVVTGAGYGHWSIPFRDSHMEIPSSGDEAVVTSRGGSPSANAVLCRQDRQGWEDEGRSQRCHKSFRFSDSQLFDQARHVRRRRCDRP
jgi:hypothetical protein